MSQGLHQDEKRQFERLLRQQRMNRLGDRLAVVDVFLNSEEHLTVEGWCKLLKKTRVEPGAFLCGPDP